ncbi:probable amidase At4g34880 [Dendrobium catenatum]|uniref:Glutamyl-tRNA(Gln) amidotransferase subunit A, chloroplastic/mitochondrial n=1 Tax=Dendrobium catenatum TaxID=906689 RepID=A0A2I0VVD6_9ASPA|nr:probable amidase At4g34880 [Dendrobium catenatum]PKU67371.1 Glutamyl-tRNA(Gln) amidotransferase subunit A, chloroplastic/mitochondrial [Dendrobium catenatum]
MASPLLSLLFFLHLLQSFAAASTAATATAFDFHEATILDIQAAFNDGSLTSQQLVIHYLEQIKILNPYLRAVIEINPDALYHASRADQERKDGSFRHPLHGIPILLKDSIATRDRLNTTAGSFALLGSIVPRDARVVKHLRLTGAIILGKSTMSEWAHFRSTKSPNGWCARGGQGRNPYAEKEDPCGSSSGSAIAVAANMVAVSLGMETDGSILCPAAKNSVVGIKPTVGLTSRAGVIPISPKQDTIGPFGRTVADAVTVLDAIVGFDRRDAEATSAAARFIPSGGFRRFLNLDGLKGKRVGILRRNFFDFAAGSMKATTFAAHFETMRQRGAILVDNLELANVTLMLNQIESGEVTQLLADFKLSLKTYLQNLVSSPVRSLHDIIAFNNNHSVEERTEEFGQDILMASQKTNGIGAVEREARNKMDQLSNEGMEKLMKENRLDAIVFPDALASSALAIGGYPAISVPAGYSGSGAPFGICFGGLKGSDHKLIEIAYAFEQATRIRKPPTLMV